MAWLLMCTIRVRGPKFLSNLVVPETQEPSLALCQFEMLHSNITGDLRPSTPPPRDRLAPQAVDTIGTAMAHSIESLPDGALDFLPFRPYHSALLAAPGGMSLVGPPHNPNLSW